MGVSGIGILVASMLICQNRGLNSGRKKFETNVKRDYVVRMELQDIRIKCLIVWECTVKRMKKNQEDCRRYLKIVERFLEEDQMFLEI